MFIFVNFLELFNTWNFHVIFLGWKTDKWFNEPKDANLIH